MSNPTDRDKEANPIAEIFDEMFTLLQDLETRSVAVLEYVKEQGGATDEKLAPYLDRAGAAADVRWRAARARMEHLLAPKPKSSTDVAKGDKSASQSQPKEKGKDADSTTAKSQGEKQSGAKPESKDLGKELASAPSGTDKPAEQKDDKTQTAKAETEAKKENEKGSDKQSKEPSKSSNAESQAASLAPGTKSEPEKGENAKTAQSENGKSSNRQPREDGQQTQKAAK